MVVAATVDLHLLITVGEIVQPQSMKKKIA